MDFSLTEEQILLRDSVEKFVADNCSVDRHRSLLAAGRGFDTDTWQQFAELGWLSVPFAAEHGGFEGGAVDVMVVAEALGKGQVREPFLHTVITCGALLQLGGNAQQQANTIPGIIDGSNQWAFAFAEDNNSYDRAKVGTQVTAQGSDYVLNGKKIAVLNGDAADHLIVSATTWEGVALFIVDATHSGVNREVFVALDGARGAHVTFENVVLKSDQLLGSLSGGLELMERAIDKSIIAMGAEALGAMQALLDATVEYTKTRQQFGQPIGKFQSLQHAMADMYMKVEETTSLLLNAAIVLDQGSDDAPAACAALKVKLAEAGRLVSQQAVQLHGGIGMTDELGIGHYYKRLMVLGKLYGDEAYYVDRFAALEAA